MSDTSSGSKEDVNGKARYRDDKAPCISGGGGGCYEMLPCAYIEPSPF